MATKAEKFFENNTDGISTTTINYSGYGYGRQYAGMTHVYGYDDKGLRFDYVVTFHRSRVIMNMIRSGEWWLLDSAIRDNYSTNGYNTRRGIKNADVMRCRKMQESHDRITEKGKDAHDTRVLLRN